MATGADVVADQFAKQGISWVSTLCGNGLNPLYAALIKRGIRVIDFHNEQAASYMADGYSRLTNRLSVCMVSSGIAHVNALSGLVNSYFEGAPLLLISGASPGSTSGRGVFQELDQSGICSPVCKYSRTVTRIDELPFVLKDAISAAISERPGPVHLTIPIDVLESDVPSAGPTRVESTPSPPPSPIAVKRAAGLLEKSERPLIVAGSGLSRERGWESLKRFSERFQVPFVVPIWDRGCVEEKHENFLGVVGAASGEPPFLSEADLIILAGADPDYRVGFLEPPKVDRNASTIRVDPDPCMLRQGHRVTLTVQSSPSLFLEMLSGRLESSADRADWLARCRAELERFRGPLSTPPGGEEIETGRDIVRGLESVLTDEVLFLIDGGNIGQWAHMLLADRYPSNWLTCGPSAVVGWGLGGAMGAKVAFPERSVLLLSGDGAFGFNIIELETAVRHGIPFVAVVANDRAWGIVVCGQRREWRGSTVASELGEIRFDQVARSLGAEGYRVTTKSELRDRVVEGFENRVPTVIDVPIRTFSPSEARM